MRQNFAKISLCSALCLGGFIGAGTVSAHVPEGGIRAHLAPGPVVLTPQMRKNIEQDSRLSVQDWGVAPTGEKVQLVSLRDEKGHEIRISTYGAIVQYIASPDKNGAPGNVALGYKDLKGYLENPGPHFGATIGRVTNRIGGGEYVLNGKTYRLERNERGNTIHSGSAVDYSMKAWKIKSKGFDANNSWVVLTRLDPASESFPGNVNVDVKFNLGKDGVITIDYLAKSDKDTPINLTNHTYWNLQGEGTGNVEKESLQLNADRYTVVDAKSVPTGEIASVAGSVFDYRQPVVIGSRIHSDNQQMVYARGLDQNFVLGDKPSKKPQFAARVSDPVSGRVLEVYTTEPSIQAYTGNSLDGGIVGTSGKTYRQTDGLALEAQHAPDSVHHANFPSTILRAGKVFHSQTIWKLSVAQ